LTLHVLSKISERRFKLGLDDWGHCALVEGFHEVGGGGQRRRLARRLLRHEVVVAEFRLPDHPDVAIAEHNLANLYRNLNRPAEAVRPDEKIAKGHRPPRSVLDGALHAEHGLAYHVETVVRGPSGHRPGV
jgi:hypothetical protein